MEQSKFIPQALHVPELFQPGTGEGQEEVVDAFIQAALSYYGKRGELDSTPLPILLEQEKDSRLSSSPLRYPGKLAADLPGNRLFISDSNNNRCLSKPLSHAITFECNAE